jgi:hypothetical protein
VANSINVGAIHESPFFITTPFPTFRPQFNLALVSLLIIHIKASLPNEGGDKVDGMIDKKERRRLKNFLPLFGFYRKTHIRIAIFRQF